MSNTILTAINLKWLDAANTYFSADVTTADIITPISFVASPSDVEAHGVDLFNRAVTNGEFGVIAAYVPPTLSASKLSSITVLDADYRTARDANTVTSSISSIIMPTAPHKIVELEQIYNHEVSLSSVNMSFVDSASATQTKTLAEVLVMLNEMKADNYAIHQVYLSHIASINAAVDVATLNSLTLIF